MIKVYYYEKKNYIECENRWHVLLLVRKWDHLHITAPIVTVMDIIISIAIIPKLHKHVTI